MNSGEKKTQENTQENTRKIIIGTRGSDLALRQTNIVSAALMASDPSISIEVKVITTTGDINQNPIPVSANGKGWFTKEIEEELLVGKIDLAVHSLKDLGEKQPQGLVLAACLPREDARDVLITKKGESLEQLPKGAVIGTDSPRRRAGIQALRPDLNVTSLRGNVPTRLKKLDDAAEKYDAIILAAAGLKRLGLEKRITRYFEPSEMVPAPGQGILAIEVRSDDQAIQKILEKINDRDAMQIADIERSFSRATGSSCKSPTGAYAFRKGDQCFLMGMIAGENGLNMVRGEMSAVWNNSHSLGESLAKELLVKFEELNKKA